MKKSLIFIFLVLLLITSGCIEENTQESEVKNNISNNGNYTDAKITFTSGEEIKGNISVEISDTRKERRRGLMGRDSLPNRTGMLFIFENERIRKFWMKDTTIPLDIIFVDSKGNIINIEHASPGFKGRRRCSNPYYYCSERPAKFVIEVERGYINETGISPGDEIEIRR